MNHEIENYRYILNTSLGEKKYFDFEEDFVEENIRCIPMIVRLKMDLVGIKLKLAEWSRFSIEERIELALKQCQSNKEQEIYHAYLSELVKMHTGNIATVLEINPRPEFMILESIPVQLLQSCKDFNFEIGIAKWKALSELQRFALLKLCRPGHENRNFPKAMREFNLTHNQPNQ
jgi:hypothetical protein